jgi:hypothetical protein
MDRVRVKSTYVYIPNLFDLLHVCSDAQYGECVRVINLPHAPKANTMGQCHIESLDGDFLGMVSVKSLHKAQ